MSQLSPRRILLALAAIVVAMVAAIVQHSGGNDGGSSGSQSSAAPVNPGDGVVHWANVSHDSFDLQDRSPFGAVPAGSEVTLGVHTQPWDVVSAEIQLERTDPVTGGTSQLGRVPMTWLKDVTAADGTTSALWTATVRVPEAPGVLGYRFVLHDGAAEAWYADDASDGHDNLRQGGTGLTRRDDRAMAFQITVYDPDFATPAWLADAVVYQIFPDRYRNGNPANDYCVDGSTSGCPPFFGGSGTPIAHTTWNEAIGDPRGSGSWAGTFNNQFYGGDLAGITAKLDQIRALGVDTLYLNPIFSASSNHRYDTSDYLTVDPALGTQADFDALVAGLQQRGMHLILDGVFNHSSADSVYFDRYHRFATEGACESTGSAYRSWYVFHDEITPCLSSSYDGWWGYDSLAVYADDSSAMRDYLFGAKDSVLATWYARGASGWRFDVADEISHDFWTQLRPVAKAITPDGPLIGEAWGDASTYLTGGQLDSVMNYRFRKNVLGFARGEFGWKDNDNNGNNEIVPLTPSQFDRAQKAVLEDYPFAAASAMLNLLDSHDTNRALFVLTETGDTALVQAKERLALAALLQFTWIGAPMIYYGDEVGMNAPSIANGTNGPEDDPYNRAPYPWPDATGDPTIYGPADPELVAAYTALAAIRSDHPVLRTGEIRTLLTGDTTPATTDDTTYAFARGSGDDVVIVAVNNGSAANTATIPVEQGDGTVFTDALSGATTTAASATLTVIIPPRSGVILTPAS